jgi:putative transposase
MLQEGKHLLALEEGYRESKESWLALLRQLKRRGMNEPAIAVGDGGLGFWSAASEVWRLTREQRCWLHKVRNILDKLAQRERGEAAQQLRAIYLSKRSEEAKAKAVKLAKSWKGMFDKAAECLLADFEQMLSFYEFPAEHHKQLRTTNPIESVFAGVRLRTDAAKRMRSSRSALHLIFQVIKGVEKKWQRISHGERLRRVKLPGGEMLAA